MATDVKVDKDIEDLLQSIEKGSSLSRYKLVMFNDSHHTMDEVARQLIKATQCTRDVAIALMLEAHNTGSAIVKLGSKEECLKAQKILEEIRLDTSLEEEHDSNG